MEQALDALLDTAPRRRRSDVDTGCRRPVVVVDDAARAVDAANAIAPEHLELMCEAADLLVPLVRNAGAVFVGG